MDKKIQYSTDPTWSLVKNFDESEFKADQEYGDKVFGWYKGTYVAVIKD